MAGAVASALVSLESRSGCFQPPCISAGACPTNRWSRRLKSRLARSIGLVWTAGLGRGGGATQLYVMSIYAWLS